MSISSHILILFFYPSKTSISDTLGLHRVENPSHSDGAVSLHLYCPPYSSCSIFNQKTGKQSKCTVEFYSKFGQRQKFKVNFKHFMYDQIWNKIRYSVQDANVTAEDKWICSKENAERVHDRANSWCKSHCLNWISPVQLNHIE